MDFNFKNNLQKEYDDLLFHAIVQVDKHVVKKNGRPIYVNRRTGRPFTGKSKDLKEAEEHLVLHLRQACKDAGLTEPLSCELWCVFHFYYPRQKLYTKSGKLNRRVGDLTNLIELPQDCLQEAGVILDDSLVCSVDLSRRFTSDKHYVEIFILDYSKIQEVEDKQHGDSTPSDSQRGNGGVLLN